MLRSFPQKHKEEKVAVTFSSDLSFLVMNDASFSFTVLPGRLNL